jgi:hypothetical protein
VRAADFGNVKIGSRKIIFTRFPPALAPATLAATAFFT